MATLSPKAILEGRTSNRHSVPLILGLLFTGGCLLLAMLYLFDGGGAAFTTIGTVAAVPTAIMVIALILLLDRLEPEPTLNLVIAFCWGGGVAVLGAIVLNETGEALLVGLFGAEQGSLLGTTVVAPLVEESLKGSFLLALLIFRRQEIDGPTDGIVYGGMTAVGFAVVEDVLYYVNTMLSGEGGVGFLVFVRGFLSPLGHPMYTAMTGLAVAYVATHRGAARFLLLPCGWLFAVLLHASWNVGASFGLGGFLLAYLLGFITLIVLGIVLFRDRRHIIGLIEKHLPMYGNSGLITPQDVQMLGKMRLRRQARRWAQANAGFRGRQAMSDFQLASTELALLHARAENQAIEPVKFHPRRDAIVALMGAARRAFFNQAPTVAPPPWAGQGGTAFVAPANSGPLSLPAYQPRTAPGMPASGPMPQQPPMPPPGAPRSGPVPQAGPAGPMPQAPRPAQPPTGMPPQGPAPAPRPPQAPPPGPPRGPSPGGPGFPPGQPGFPPHDPRGRR